MKVHVSNTDARYSYCITPAMNAALLEVEVQLAEHFCSLGINDWRLFLLITSLQTFEIDSIVTLRPGIMRPCLKNRYATKSNCVMVSILTVLIPLFLINFKLMFRISFAWLRILSCRQMLVNDLLLSSLAKLKESEDAVWVCLRLHFLLIKNIITWHIFFIALVQNCRRREFPLLLSQLLRMLVLRPMTRLPPSRIWYSMDSASLSGGNRHQAARGCGSQAGLPAEALGILSRGGLWLPLQKFRRLTYFEFFKVLIIVLKWIGGSPVVPMSSSKAATRK